MNNVESYLDYNAETGRMHVRQADKTSDGLHCGDTITALVEGAWVWTRIERNFSTGEWYLLIGKGNTRSAQGVQVRP